MSDANDMTTLVAIARFSKMMEKLYLYMALALGMVTVTVYGNGCIFYSQYMVSPSPYEFVSSGPASLAGMVMAIYMAIIRFIMGIGSTTVYYYINLQ